MRHAHLVAVTLGGAEGGGDHVAVAIKVSCFCPWIAEHLPYVPTFLMALTVGTVKGIAVCILLSESTCCCLSLALSRRSV